MIKNIIFSMLISFSISLVVIIAETYDSAVYYYQYTQIKEIGLNNFALTQLEEAGKFEPGLYFIYDFFPGELNILTFVFLNYIIIYIVLNLLFKVVSGVVENHHPDNGNYRINLYYLTITLFFWYPSYLNILWVWRSYISTIFFFISIVLFYSDRVRLSILMMLCAIFVHAVSFIFAVLFVLTLVLDKINVKKLILKCVAMFLFGGGLGLLILSVRNYFGFIFSGGDSWSKDSDASSFVTYIYVMLIYFLLVSFIKKVKHLFMNKLIIYSFFVAGVALCFVDEHLMLTRFLMLISINFCLALFIYCHRLSRNKRIIMMIAVIPGFLATIRSVFLLVDKFFAEFNSLNV